jgi:hypothetical protein
MRSEMDYPVEAIKFIYRESKLSIVRYMFASQENCGEGYKGYGMTQEERGAAEAYLVEVEDVEAPYVYELRGENRMLSHPPFIPVVTQIEKLETQSNSEDSLPNSRVAAATK